MEEQVFLDERGVKVTNARFITFGKTQTLAGITSVTSLVQKPSRVGPIVLIIIGLILVTWTFGILLILGIVWWIMQKPIYIVQLESASGASNALSDKDCAFVDRVVEALNQAIIARG